MKIGIISPLSKLKNRNSKKNVWKLYQVPGFLWIFLMSIPVFFITFTHIGPRIAYTPMKMENINIDDVHKGYLIRTPGCKIPDLPVFDKNLEKYFKYDFHGAHCNKDKPPLVQSNLTSLFLIETSFAEYNITDKHQLHCCYEELKRKIPIGQMDDQYGFGKVCFDFEESVEIEQEFVHVKCDYVDKQIYEDFFAFIPPKHNNTSFDINQKQSNVLIIGIDGISRLNFRRQMSKSVRYLEQLDFVEFLGYNKIADNTYPNLIGVLTGENEKTIDITCKNSTKYFDNCTFIWNYFKAENYTTSFGEDSAWMGIFNYQKYGFQKQPTDYMWGFFERIGEKLLGNSKSINVMQCIGSREAYKMFVQYIHDFVSRMKSWKIPYFAFFWGSSLSHDELNKPRIGDEVYLNFFQSMYNGGYFENTIVIIMSDHGIRYGEFRQTYQGRIEERLPFLFIRLPQEFKDKYPSATSNLKRNARMLTTPFDLHETLFDLSSPYTLSDEFVVKGKRKSKNKDGLSLFQKIEPTRTCEDAGIADHWCTCLDSTTVKIDSKMMELANFTVNSINKMLKGYAQCDELHLKEISNAQVLSHSEKSMGNKGKIEDFLLNFQTLPGDGLFEATVRQYNETKMEIVGSISRLNFYGKQSACVTDFHLKLYCYCKKSIWI